MDLPYNWDFLQDNLPSEKLAELRRRFMDEWRSGEYTKEEMIERYRMSERTFWYTIKRYADAKELEDYTDKPCTADRVTDQISKIIGNSITYNENIIMAYTDELTGLFNRRFFITSLRAKLKRAFQNDTSLSVTLLDIDNFKRINDCFGHIMGDMALKNIAQVLKKSIRKNDVITRFGGDEFALILENTDEQKAFEVAKRIRASVEKQQIYLGDKIAPKLTISSGIATYPINAKNPEDL